MKCTAYPESEKKMSVLANNAQEHFPKGLRVVPRFTVLVVPKNQYSTYENGLLLDTLKECKNLNC